MLFRFVNRITFCRTFISERATSLELRLFSVYTNRKVNEVMDELTKFFEHWPSMKHVDITFVHPEGDVRDFFALLTLDEHYRCTREKGDNFGMRGDPQQRTLGKNFQGILFENILG